MKQQTAIDWLIEKLANINPTQVEWHEAIAEAKVIEKNQITKAMLDGAYGNSLMTKQIADKYYEETYKK